MRKQVIRYTAMGVIGVVLVVALTVLVNWLGARHWLRGDWTSSGMYTLSEKTLNVLSGLDQDVRVVVFMTPASQLYEQVHELLDRYRAASGSIDVTYIDVERERLKAEQLAQEFGVSVADTVVFEAAGRTKHVTTSEMAEMDYSGMRQGQPPTVRSFTAENEFTGAILSLVAPSVPKVYVLTGHGEAPLAGDRRTGWSLAVLKQLLERENLEVAELSLLSGIVPDDADAVMIIGPTKPLTEAEIGALDEYVLGGGRLLVSLDPLLAQTGEMKATRLEPFLAKWGARVGDDLVVDPGRRLPGFDLSAVYLSDFQPHAVTRGLDNVAVLFAVTRSVEPASVEGLSATSLVETSDEGWGETDLVRLSRREAIDMDDGDTPGPVAVGVAVEQRDVREEPEGSAEGGKVEEVSESEHGARLVVFGDSDFLTDGQIGNVGNATLALNAVHWLVQQEEALGIPGRSVEQVNLYLSESQMGTIVLITLILMPGLAIVAGILVWRRRRH